MTNVTADTLVNLREYIDGGKLMVLSTKDKERLHMSSVWYAHDGDYRRFYFTSRDTRVHSENIRANGAVGGAIVAIELVGLGQKTQGVFFSGDAHECSGDDVDTAYDAYRQRWPQVEGMFSASDIHSGATPMRMFEVEVVEYVWIDEVRSPADPRFVISKSDLNTRLSAS